MILEPPPWLLPSGLPVPPFGTVDIWRLPVPADPEADRASRALLAPEERARAQRFRQPADRCRFTVARAATRLILAACAGCAPADLVFEDAGHGKPRLKAPLVTSGWEFNVSHAGRLALVAVTRVTAVGVDLEARDRPVEPRALAERVLAPGEIERMDGMSAPAAARFFLRTWTAKEAVVKALGRGLAQPLTAFAVVEARDGTMEVQPGPGLDLPPVTLQRLNPDPAHLGALAVVGPAVTTRRWCGSELFRSPEGES